MRVTRACDWCGVPVQRRSTNAYVHTYCSDQCREAYLPRLAIERFWAQVIKTDWCWLWNGQKLPGGHGKFSVRTGPYTKRTVLTHRYSWELACGLIPTGLYVCHDCRPLKDNPACVNPAHLYLGTNAQNQRDAYTRGGKQPRKGESNPTAKISRAAVYAIRSLQGHMTADAAAQRFGIGPSQVYRIWYREAWAWLAEGGE
jgi:endogenous inhibitor of DNA gyrase (YacG/DUF329 family)